MLVTMDVEADAMGATLSLPEMGGGLERTTTSSGLRRTLTESRTGGGPPSFSRPRDHAPSSCRRPRTCTGRPWPPRSRSAP